MVKGRSSLQAGLDKDVYQVVRKYLDEKDESPLNLRLSAVHDYIQRSNSSLKRRPKRQLENSIDRVIDVIREDEEETGHEESGHEDAMEEKSKKRRHGGNSKEERDSKRQKKTAEAARDSKIDTAAPTNVSLSDLGGVGKVKEQLKEHLVLPLLMPQEYAELKIPIPRGILLHGPPGCGKTVICKAFAAALGVSFIEILGPSIVSGMSGESEKQVREHFAKAKEVAPCLIFIDEIDVIAPKRDTSQSQMEKRIVAQLLICMDSLAMEDNNGKPVIVIAATNRPDSLDPALRRGGRFDSEICMGVPNEQARRSILQTLTREPRLSSDVDFDILAKRTAGFVGADLKDLVSKAGTWSMAQFRAALEKQAASGETVMEIDNQTSTFPDWQYDQAVFHLVTRAKDLDVPRPEGFKNMSVSMAAFEAVLPTITPSSKREGFTTVPNTTWDDVGALSGIREELEMAICEPIKDPTKLVKYGIPASTGVLLWGPPGCGKTLLAKAVAAESKANFISVKGPELVNKYLGESERALRQVFMRARSSVPCIIFFDELDALVPKRSTELHEASARVVNTLLTELDGLSEREGIYLIAATNRPEMIDEAMLRPGRLGTLLYVGLPEPEERVSILKALIRQRGGADISPEVAEIGKLDACKNFSGADLESLLVKAGLRARKRQGKIVEFDDVVEAAKTIRPSVADLKRYQRLREEFETRLC